MAFPIATNSVRHRSTDPKSLTSASRRAQIWFTVGAEAVKIELVENHRIRRDQLFALETVDHEHGRRGEVQRAQLRGDRIQAFHGAAVVVFPVAHDQPLREPLELLRIT